MKKVVVIIFSILLVGLAIGLINLPEVDNNKYMINLVGKTISEVKSYSEKNKLDLEIIEEYSDEFLQGVVFSQSISENSVINEGHKLTINVSLGKNYEELYKEYQVNELGRVPIMMYHGIQNISDNKYTGGNIDVDGYQRTAEAFKNDLEFYYTNNYRMIKLSDYIDGKIDVELGKSPIVLTFDDGLSNNILVTGRDEEGEIIIDPNSAVGILESFKDKYPDFNVTATFFLNGGLFGQPEYNEQIIKWLIDNGYSIGNHSYSHADFSNISEEKTVSEIGRMYDILNNIIPGQYDNIVALPFGSPYVESAKNFKNILSGNFNGNEYETVSTLRVGWESEVSPFNKSFNKKFLKRIRAYDNNGKEFDIAMNFKLLEINRYISDGDINTIVIPENMINSVNNKSNYKVITY